MGQRSSVYLADDLAAEVKACGIPVAELVRRGLTAGTAAAPQPSTSSPAASSLAAIIDGEPSPGVVCMAPACWQRNTSRYGLRRLPLCPACRAALQGETYQAEIPPSAARLIQRGAA